MSTWRQLRARGSASSAGGAALVRFSANAPTGRMSYSAWEPLTDTAFQHAEKGSLGMGLVHLAATARRIGAFSLALVVLLCPTAFAQRAGDDGSLSAGRGLAGVLSAYYQALGERDAEDDLACAQLAPAFAQQLTDLLRLRDCETLLDELHRHRLRFPHMVFVSASAPRRQGGFAVARVAAAYGRGGRAGRYPRRHLHERVWLAKTARGWRLAAWPPSYYRARGEHVPADAALRPSSATSPLRVVADKPVSACGGSVQGYNDSGNEDVPSPYLDIYDAAVSGSPSTVCVTVRSASFFGVGDGYAERYRIELVAGGAPVVIYVGHLPTNTGAADALIARADADGRLSPIEGARWNAARVGSGQTYRVQDETLVLPASVLGGNWQRWRWRVTTLAKGGRVEKVGASDELGSGWLTYDAANISADPRRHDDSGSSGAGGSQPSPDEGGRGSCEVDPDLCAGGR